MIYIVVLFAFVLTWFFIEITLFFANKNLIDISTNQILSYNKFIWNLRLLAIFLLITAFIYMYYFQNTKFLEAIEYCLGIIK